MLSDLLRQRWRDGAKIAAVLAATAVAAASATGAVQGWRAGDDAAQARATYVSLQAAAAHEARYLRSAHAQKGSSDARQAFFSTAQAVTAMLLRVQQTAPRTQIGLVNGLEDVQMTATVEASRALRGGREQAHFRKALALLADLQRRAARAENDFRIGNVAPWPATTLEKLGAGELVLLLLFALAMLWRRMPTLLGLRRVRVEGDEEIERLTHVARSDSLTGLANHRAFQDDLSKAIERRNGDGIPFALLAFDLDGLKQVNDGKGHAAGDAYIKTAAACIREEVGGRGVVYRTGGDEFMALLPNARGWHALTIAHNIQRSAQQKTGRRALSVGIAESTKTESRRVLLHQADLALYEAKRAKLLAVSYHPGLEPRQVEAGVLGPSQHQKALAAALAQAVDAKDAGTRNHSETVAELTAGIGVRLGLSGEALERLRIAGLLHDVGKIGVPDAVLGKRGALQPDERTEIELHTAVGHSILTSAELHKEAVWVLHHHERFDGTGYPTGLAGDAIPLESRIVAVADAFEAMTGSRPYREALTPEQALQELDANSGTQFDPVCVRALNALFGGSSADVPAQPAKPAPAALSATA